MGGSAAEAPTSPDAVPAAGALPDGDARAAGDAPAHGAPPAHDAAPVHGGLRASDAERDEAVGELREQFAAGRLSHDTFLYRMNAALAARRQSDLPPLFADLPVLRRPGSWVGSLLNRTARLTAGLPAALRRAGTRRTGRPAVLAFPRGTETAFSIGRDRGCDLAIDDMTVSRVHARLERTPDGWMITDLASTNGTRVNGWLVRGEAPVRAGDTVRFGDSEFTLASE